MVLLETAVVAVDGLGTCLFFDVDVTFCGWPLFRSGATGEVFMSLTGVKAEVWSLFFRSTGLECGENTGMKF
ncbi:hypothetical protein TNCV_2423551 [Trichonephila clavipes]|nr:hypothetical protein TNCV_2423551 [Trichonephila clavipes]